MKLGAYKYIHKPLDADEFEGAIEKVVNNFFHEMKHAGREITPINKRR
jgi:predicted transcriptional regulator